MSKVTIEYGPDSQPYCFVSGDTLETAINDVQVKRALALPNVDAIRVINEEGESLQLNSSLVDGAVYTVEKAGNDKGATVKSTFAYGPEDYPYNSVTGETIKDALENPQVKRALALPDIDTVRVMNEVGEILQLNSSLVDGAVYTVEKAGNDKG